ncbi:MAG: hypothetical protein ACK4KV_07060 [Rhodocyclaceae bacterium]
MDSLPLTPIPTDSVLRRHFEQLARSLGLPGSLPQDSIQVRHYLQTLDARSTRSAAAGAQAVEARHQRPAPTRSGNGAEHESASRLLRTHTEPRPEPRPSVTAAPAPEPRSWLARLIDRIAGR